MIVIIIENKKSFIVKLSNRKSIKYLKHIYGDEIGFKLAKLSNRTGELYKNYIEIHDDIAIMYIYSKKHGILNVLIDIEDIQKVQQFKWKICKKKDHNSYYCDTHDKSSGKDKKLQLHRYIMNYDGELIIDHKNRNGLDNRRCNLRIVSVEINGKNSSKQKNNKNRNLPTGVYYDKKENVFRVFWSENKQSRGKRFSVSKLGFEKARNKAIMYRYKKCLKYDYDLTDIIQYVQRNKLIIRRNKKI